MTTMLIMTTTINLGDWLIDEDEQLLGQVFATARSGKLWVRRRVTRDVHGAPHDVSEHLIDPAGGTIRNPCYAPGDMLEVASQIYDQQTWRRLEVSEVPRWVRAKCWDRRYNNRLYCWEYFFSMPPDLFGYFEEAYVRAIGDLPALSDNTLTGREPMLGRAKSE